MADRLTEHTAVLQPEMHRRITSAPVQEVHKPLDQANQFCIGWLAERLPGIYKGRPGLIEVELN